MMMIQAIIKVIFFEQNEKIFVQLNHLKSFDHQAFIKLDGYLWTTEISMSIIKVSCESIFRET